MTYKAQNFGVILTVVTYKAQNFGVILTVVTYKAQNFGVVGHFDMKSTEFWCRWPLG